MKILIADAHGLYREGLKLILSQITEQATFLEVDNQHDVELLLKLHSDIALLSLESYLPDGEGLPFIQHVRLHYPQLPIVICSASHNTSMEQVALDMGVTQCVSKTLSNAQLKHSYKTALPHTALLPGHSSNAEHYEKSAFIKLTPRQQQVLSLLSNGLSNKEIGQHLQLAEGTVKAHVAALMRTLVAKNRIEVTNRARQLGAIA